MNIFRNWQDKDLILSNMRLLCSLEEYEKEKDNAGQNWHSGGPIVISKTKLCNFTDTAQEEIKNFNAKLKDDDVVSIEFDEEWGIFLRFFRENENYCYFELKADCDEFLCNIDYLKEAELEQEKGLKMTRDSQEEFEDIIEMA